MGEANKFEDIPYNIFEEKKLLFFLIGWNRTYDEKTGKYNVWYVLYIFPNVVLQFYVQVMAFYAGYLLTAEKSLLFDSVHVITASWFGIWGITTRVFGGRSLIDSMEHIRPGIYLYEGEDLDEEQTKMKERIPTDLKTTKEFQSCLYSSVKENLKDLQTLMKFREDCRVYVGSILLNVFILVAIIYAAVLYQIYQTLPYNIYVNYACTSLPEQTYTTFICYFGEEVIDEVLAAMYKLMHVARQSDILD